MSIATETYRAETAEAAIVTSVSAETARATNAEAILSNTIILNAAIVANYHTGAAADALTASAGILSSQSTNISLNTMAIAALQGFNVSQSSFVNNATGQLNSLQSAITLNATNIAYENQRALGVEQAMTELIATIKIEADPTIAQSITIANEITRSTAVDATLTSGLSNEISRATAVENTLFNNCSNEVTRATAAETTLNTAIQTELSRASNAELTNTRMITTEFTRAIAAEQALAVSISQASSGPVVYDQTLNSFWYGAFGGTSSHPPGSYGSTVRVYRIGSMVTLSIQQFTWQSVSNQDSITYASLLPSWACPPIMTTVVVSIWTDNLNAAGVLSINTNGSMGSRPMFQRDWNYNCGFIMQTCVSYLV